MHAGRQEGAAGRNGAAERQRLGQRWLRRLKHAGMLAKSAGAAAALASSAPCSVSRTSAAAPATLSFTCCAASLRSGEGGQVRGSWGAGRRARMRGPALAAKSRRAGERRPVGCPPHPTACLAESSACLALSTSDSSCGVCGEEWREGEPEPSRRPTARTRCASATSRRQVGGRQRSRTRGRLQPAAAPLDDALTPAARATSRPARRGLLFRPGRGATARAGRAGAEESVRACMVAGGGWLWALLVGEWVWRSELEASDAGQK